METWLPGNTFVIHSSADLVNFVGCVGFPCSSAGKESAFPFKSIYRLKNGCVLITSFLVAKCPRDGMH